MKFINNIANKFSNIGNELKEAKTAFTNGFNRGCVKQTRINAEHGLGYGVGYSVTTIKLCSADIIDTLKETEFVENYTKGYHDGEYQAKVDHTVRKVVREINRNIHNTNWDNIMDDAAAEAAN